MFSVNGFYIFDINDSEITYNDVFYTDVFSHDILFDDIREKICKSKSLLQPFTIIANNLAHNNNAIKDIVKCTFEKHICTPEYNNNKALQLAYNFNPSFVSVVKVATYDKITHKISNVFKFHVYDNLLESLTIWNMSKKSAIKANAEKETERFKIKTWINNYIADVNMSPETVAEYIKQDIYGGFID